MSIDIPYRTSARPWFGPRRRAREFLEKRDRVLPAADALAVLVDLLGEHTTSVQECRFIDYFDKEKSFRFTIVLVWTNSNPEVRDFLYESASNLVAACGWYPLPQGERMRSRLAEKDFQRKFVQHPPALSFGTLRSVENAVGPEGGCSIRLRTTNGALVLDAGLPGFLSPDPEDRLILLSHAHDDHSGGIRSGGRSLPALTSAATARVTQLLHRATEHDLRTRFHAHPQNSLQLGTISIESFPVPHFVGSTGYTIDDGTTCLVYTGDVVLSSGRHSFMEELDTFTARPDRKTIVLLDATMAGRSAGATQGAEALRVLDHLRASDDVALIADSPEHLLYAYLDLFYSVSQNPHWRGVVHFLVTGRLRPFFQMLHSAFFGGDASNLDRFITAQYGATRSAWAESRNLFWLDRLSSRPSSKRIWFATPPEYTTLGAASIDTVLLGRCTPEALGTHASLLPIDSDAWSLHSREQEIAEAVRSLSAKEAHVLLFHNFSGRLRKFIRNAAIEATPLSSEPLSISAL